MRKRIPEPREKSRAESDEGWLNPGEMATMEVISDDARLPVEMVFNGDGDQGCGASQPGQQLMEEYAGPVKALV
jgi:hypothetical protein